MSRAVRVVAALVAAAGLALSGCGSGDEPGPAPTSTEARPPLKPSDPRADGIAYLALGDSLSQGAQRRREVAETTDEGYPDVLAARLADAGTPVVLSRIGCSGATTASLRDGGKPCAEAPPGTPPYRNEDPATSQLAFAEAFLRARGDRPTLVTIDIGANDVLGCIRPTPAEVRRCYREGIDALRDGLRDVAGRLRAAAGRRTVLATMTIYDPAVVLVRRPDARDAALAFHRVVQAANRALIREFSAEGFLVARADRAFRTDEPATRPGVVETTCELTRLCTTPQDFHPNAEGYARIADAFRAVVREPVARLGG